jgi:selenide, water dikinase
MKSVPAQYDLVLVGGGHAHALALRMLTLRMSNNSQPLNARITLISPQPLAAYSGMLPGLIAGHYAFEDTHIDLPQLCQWADVRLIQQEVIAVDTSINRLSLADGSSVDYDWLSLNVGGTPAVNQVPGADKFAIAVKPVSSFYPRWKTFVDTLTRSKANNAQADKTYAISVVGSGAGGCELILAMAHALQRRALTAKFTLIGSDFLSDMPAKAQQKMADAMAYYGIDVQRNTTITEVTNECVVTANGNIHHDTLFWCTGVNAPEWLAHSSLLTTDDGFVQVDQTLKSLSTTNVFAAGDCAWQAHNPAPRAGVYAVRQAKVLAHNLLASIQGDALKHYAPQKHFLSILALGEKKAIAVRRGLAISGSRLWQLKDRIDRAFVKKLNVLPTRPILPIYNAKEDVRCAGCGAKVGDAALRKALTGITPISHKNIIAGLAQREDASVIDWQPGKLLVQSQDYFPAFVSDPYLFGRIAALHSLSDIHARNAQAHSALASVCLPVNHQRLQGRDLERLMRGAVEELNRAGCALLGGHTIEGPQMAAGFTINGSATQEQLLSKGGAHVGDNLILTKPLGSGILLSALMQQVQAGRYLDTLLEQMLISNENAATIFHHYSAQAVTDITGFGLLGHLLELCDASHVSAALDTNSVPVLPGATTLFSRGIFSTLKSSNDAALARCRIAPAFINHPMLAILTDPQTSGGLIGAVAVENTQACLNAMAEKGQQAWVIGVVTEENVRRIDIR